jgi:hypothetical protein
MGVESAVAYSQLPEFKSSFIFRLRLRSSRKGEARRDHRSGCTKSFHGFLLWREVLWAQSRKDRLVTNRKYEENRRRA